MNNASTTTAYSILASLLFALIAASVIPGVMNARAANNHATWSSTDVDGGRAEDANVARTLHDFVDGGSYLDKNVINEGPEGAANLHSPASILRDEVDILQLLNVSHKTSGVSLIEGPIKGFPAYKFRPSYNGDVQLANSTPVTQALTHGDDGFTLVFIFRQQRKTLGTLLSVNSPGRLSPWFQITSNLRTGQLVLHFRVTTDSKLHQIYWPMSQQHHKAWPLAAWTWLSITADYNTSTLRLDADCLPSRYQTFVTRGDPYKHPRIQVPSDALVYFRQEPGRKKKFMGSMQVAKVLPYVSRQRLWTCDEIIENVNPAHRRTKLF